jgi:hypothetical protein
LVYDLETIENEFVDIRLLLCCNYIKQALSDLFAFIYCLSVMPRRACRLFEIVCTVDFMFSPHCLVRQLALPEARAISVLSFFVFFVLKFF